MSTLYRLIAINFTMARYGLDEIILSIHFFRPLRFLGLVNPFNWFRSNSLSRAERLRLCIESLGPIFIKFGQMIATRRDLVDEGTVAVDFDANVIQVTAIEQAIEKAGFDVAA